LQIFGPAFELIDLISTEEEMMNNDRQTPSATEAVTQASRQNELKSADKERRRRGKSQKEDRGGSQAICQSRRIHVTPRETAKLSVGM
jgi:hypothetical protein